MNSEKKTDDFTRRVRSFVRRPGRLTPGQKRALEELWPRYGVTDAATLNELDALFGRQGAARTLEIGYGDGSSLVEQAAGSPEADFLGLEVHEPGIGHCLLAIEAAGITNVRLMAADAIDVLRSALPAQSLNRINLYFPDPWPKKRHHKRRIVNPEFLQLAARCLASGGRLHIATDWAPYAEWIIEILGDSADFRLLEHTEHAGDEPLQRPNTKFERRGLRLGHRINDWIYERR